MRCVVVIAGMMVFSGGAINSGRTTEVAKPALQSLADSLHREIATVLSDETWRDPVLALKVEADTSILGREARLVQEFERLLFFRLENGVEVAGVVSSAQGEHRAASLLLRVVLGVEQQKITATADLTPMYLPFWSRLVDPAPRGAKHHLFASENTDEEIIVLLGRSAAPPPMGNWHMQELLTLPGRILDLGLGDVDGDSRDDLVLMFEDVIEVYSLHDDKPRRLARFGLEMLPDVLTPTRDPVGSVLVSDFNRDGRAEIFLRNFNHRHGLILVWSGSQLREVRKLELVPLCVFELGARPTLILGRPKDGKNSYEAEVELVDINGSEARSFRLPSGFMTLRCWQDPSGGQNRVLAVDEEGAFLKVESDFSSRKMFERVGVGMAAVDFELDKDPEWVVSDAVWPGESDSIRVMRGEEILWKSRDVIGGVVAIAGGTRLATGKSVALVATVDAAAHNSRVYLLGR